MQSATLVEALAALYAYESQVPRIAREKAAGLRRFYGAEGNTCRYFDLHQTADLEHARIWREQIEHEIATDGHPQRRRWKQPIMPPLPCGAPWMGSRASKI